MRRTHRPLRSAPLLMVILALLLLFSGQIVAADETVVFQADFEAASPGSPPAGWSMWGAQMYKDPANFTRDEHLPRSGEACFRIHHPANTGGYRFHHWEIANEPSVGRAGRAFPTADAFLEHFLEVSRAVRAVDPDAKIGMPIHPRSPAWGNYLLKRAVSHYDFVVGHYYSFANVERSSFEDVVLTGNYRVLDEILKTNALLQHYNPGRDVYQYDTEWGMHSFGPQGERADYVNRNANIFGMTHRAVRLIHYLREGMLRGASSWEMFAYQRAPGFGFLARDAPRRRSSNYWLYYYFNRHAGRWVVDIDGTAPYHTGSAGGRTYKGPLTPAVATLSGDGQRVFLLLANGSWSRAVPCRLELREFPFRQAAGVILSHSDADGHPFLDRLEDLVSDLPLSVDGKRLSTTIPPHSVVFRTLQL